MREMTEIPGSEMARIPARVREMRPLVYHITNAVAANLVANATLAVGASPVMAPSPEESREMASLADAVVLNLGMPSRQTVRAMVLAGRAANARGVPVIFDPVGAGSTSFRSAVAARILKEIRVSVVRGNAAEIAFLVGIPSRVRGVESVATCENPGRLALLAARKLGTVVALTGPVDYVSDGRRLAAVKNGDPVMTEMSGSGCVVSALVGAFCAAADDFFLASAAALAYAGVAGELAARQANGPGSFQTAWLDGLRNLSVARFLEMARVSFGTPG